MTMKKLPGRRWPLGLATAVAAILANAPQAAEDPQITVERGARVFQENCASCHGADLGGYLAPALNKERLKGRSATSLRSTIMAGSFDTLMPPFYGKLSDEDIRSAVKYISSTDKLDPQWTMDDIKKSLKVYVADESTLPDNRPTPSTTWTT